LWSADHSLRNIALTETEPRFLRRCKCSLAAMPTETSQLHFRGIKSTNMATLRIFEIKLSLNCWNRCVLLHLPAYARSQIGSPVGLYVMIDKFCNPRKQQAVRYTWCVLYIVTKTTVSYNTAACKHCENETTDYVISISLQPVF
jgi:hypothetical protein